MHFIFVNVNKIYFILIWSTQKFICNVCTQIFTWILSYLDNHRNIYILSMDIYIYTITVIYIGVYGYIYIHNHCNFVVSELWNETVETIPWSPRYLVYKGNVLVVSSDPTLREGNARYIRLLFDILVVPSWKVT